MIKLLSSKKKKQQNFYMPGQEIRVNNGAYFHTNAGKEENANTFRPKIALIIAAFSLVYVAICIKLIILCTSDNLISDKYRGNAPTEGIKLHRVIKRADIVDRNNNIIATSLPTTHLHKNVKKVEDAPLIAQELSEILTDMSYEKILKLLEKQKSFVYIKRDLTPSQIYQINALGHHELEFEKAEKRIYLNKNLFSHLVGYTDTENNGIAGIEKQMNDRLVSSDIPLQLSVDLVVQDIIHQEMEAAVEKFNAVGGVAMLMDVNTGEIISMLSLPDFDPNIRKFKNEDAIKNFATEGTYEAGSVFKVFNAAMGLNTKKITLNEKFDTTKDIKLKYNTIKDYRGERRWLTLGEVLIYSSNIGSARISLKVGKDDQKKFLKSLGFFEKVPNIEVVERASPLLPKRWGEETVATVAYGYGISVTPLHILTAFSAIVNGGIYNEPTVLANNTNRNSHRVISQDVSETMRRLLRDVVIKGSGKNANVKGYQVAGKTGTANKIINGKYAEKGVVRTSFVSTFPASDPKYALFVMLDEPKGSKETFGFTTSGWNSVPTAGKIITRIAPQLNVQADFQLEEQKQHIIEASYHQ